MTSKLMNRKKHVKKPITNYGTLLAEIQYYESIGNDIMAERLSKLLEKAREKDREKRELENRELDKEL